ncbi:hypothetical protein STEG23_017951 [Scotinomys teguina]
MAKLSYKQWSQVYGGGACCSKVPAASPCVDGRDAVTMDEGFTAACSEKNCQDHRVTRKHRERKMEQRFHSVVTHLLLRLSLAALTLNHSIDLHGASVASADSRRDESVKMHSMFPVVCVIS